MTITMKRDKDCKGSVRFASDNEKDPVTNVYVARSMPGINEAQSIQVTVEVVAPAMSPADAELAAKLKG